MNPQTGKDGVGMMARNGKVYISHTAQDDAQVAPLLVALKSKKAALWYQRTPDDAASSLSPELQREIEQRDAFIRILTSRTQASRLMALELEEFQRLQTLDEQQGDGRRRVRINLIMDPAYERQPTDVGTLTINTTNKVESAWLPTVFAELGKLKASAELSVGAMTAIVGVAVLLALVGLIGSLAYFASVHPELIPFGRP